jgi:copper chaperone CopZ
MKHLLLGIALLWLSSSAAAAEDRTVTLDIGKMTCGLCPITVEKAIERVAGVKQVSVDSHTRSPLSRPFAPSANCHSGSICRACTAHCVQFGLSSRSPLLCPR